mmetsp:Transcript_67667/g.134257  ORF Transcript_67667/g.134257 Transcript_67667/m.134257 type:complete len:117 (-) Transcript_67667:191-541(-)
MGAKEMGAKEMGAKEMGVKAVATTTEKAKDDAAGTIQLVATQLLPAKGTPPAPSAQKAARTEHTPQKAAASYSEDGDKTDAAAVIQSLATIFLNTHMAVPPSQRAAAADRKLARLT